MTGFTPSKNGLSGFNPAAPAYLSKTHFVMLMKNQRLASLRTSFDQATTTCRQSKPRGSRKSVPTYAPPKAAA